MRLQRVAEATNDPKGKWPLLWVNEIWGLP